MSYKDVFESLNQSGIRYVVPRKYDDLPAETTNPDDDVDIIIHPDQFDAGVEICKTVGYESQNHSLDTTFDWMAYNSKQAIRNPVSTAKIIVSDHEHVLRVIKNKEIPSGNDLHDNVFLRRNGQELDLRNNLAYKSPETEERYPVRLEVTFGMLDRRTRSDGFYKPHPSDELAHIVPHSIYDKFGEFSPYYKERCETLLDEIQTDDEMKDLFLELLDLIFYAAGEFVYDLLLDGEYDQMRAELRKFSDY